MQSAMSTFAALTLPFGGRKRDLAISLILLKEPVELCELAQRPPFERLACMAANEPAESFAKRPCLGRRAIKKFGRPYHAAERSGVSCFVRFLDRIGPKCFT
jgi:hypothetical protein